MKLQPTTLIRSLLLCFSILLMPFSGRADNPVRVRDLTLNGWEIVEKSSETLRKPGVPPYETATRVIDVTTYKLAKGQQRYTCSIAYDRQQDQFEESCKVTPNK